MFSKFLIKYLFFFTILKMADDWEDTVTGTSYQGRGSAAPKTSNDSGWGVEPEETNNFNGSSRGKNFFLLF